jgi:5-methylcytosine-specific restriction protein A
MAMAPLHPCPHPHCRRLVRSAHCAEHTRQADQRPNVDIRRWYHTERWFALRREVLRADPYCGPCLAEGLGAVPARHVDHRVPHRGDPALFWDRANLQGLCPSHHSAKTGKGQ